MPRRRLITYDNLYNELKRNVYLKDVAINLGVSYCTLFRYLHDKGIMDEAQAIMELNRTTPFAANDIARIKLNDLIQVLKNHA